MKTEMKIYNIVGLIIALSFCFSNKTIESIWIMSLLIYINQNFNQKNKI